MYTVFGFCHLSLISYWIWTSAIRLKFQIRNPLSSVNGKDSNSIADTTTLKVTNMYKTVSIIDHFAWDVKDLQKCLDILKI